MARTTIANNSAGAFGSGGGSLHIVNSATRDAADCTFSGDVFTNFLGTGEGAFSSASNNFTLDNSILTNSNADLASDGNHLPIRHRRGDLSPGRAQRACIELNQCQKPLQNDVIRRPARVAGWVQFILGDPPCTLFKRLNDIHPHRAPACQR